MRAGLTWIEACLIICISGILLSVGVPAFVDAVRTSKTSEATDHLAALYRASASYYAARHRVEGHTLQSCLPDPAGPTPALASTDPVPVDFGAEERAGAATWRALAFNPANPVRFRYSVLPAQSGCGLGNPDRGPLLSLRAEGDLDGDGRHSLFERTARAVDTGTLAADPVLTVRDRIE